MSIYKQASKIKLRVPTPKGQLTVSQLWDLKDEDLEATANALEDQLEKSNNKSRFNKKTSTNPTIQLQYDIVEDIIKTIVNERISASTSQEIKSHNQRVELLIAEKKSEAEKNLSIEELEAMLIK